MFPFLLLLLPLLLLLAVPCASQPLTSVCLSYNISNGKTLTFQGTLTYNSSTNLPVRYVATRNYTYNTPYIIEYFDLLPPFAYQNNSNTVPGVIASVGLPLPTGIAWSAYVQNFSAGGRLSEYVSRVNGSNVGVWTQSSGLCPNHAATMWFYPLPQPQVACMTWTAYSSNLSISTHVSAQVTYDSSRVTSNPYDVSNSPYFGWKLLSVNGSRSVSMSGHASSAVSQFSLSATNGSLAQWSLFNFVSSSPSLAINLQTSPFAWPDNSAAWGVSTPPITGLQWNPLGGGVLMETGTGYHVTSFNINASCVAPPANMTAPAGLTAACLSGYWSDGPARSTTSTSSTHSPSSTTHPPHSPTAAYRPPPLPSSTS